MNNTTNQSDLQSFGELEKYLYNGQNAISYFQKDIKKCLPFSQRPLELTKSNGTPNFGYSWSVVVNNADGDYLSNAWIMIETPEVKLKEKNTYGDKGVIRWTENFFHNLIEECTLSFNDCVISKLDNFSLDFISEFSIDKNKYDIYMKNIGNIKELTYPNTHLQSRKLFLPLPLFFSKDTGDAIPLAALPHTEIKINFKFRQWDSLLIFENTSFIDPKISIPEIGKDIDVAPCIRNAKMYANFIIVSEEERYKIGIKNKIMLIEQIQTSPRQMVYKDPKTKIDLLFKHSIKSIYFALRNSTFKNSWSNYNHGHDSCTSGIFIKNKNNNILKSASIQYNNKNRVPELSSEYFSYINPLYHNLKTPEKDGMYVYNFSIDAEMTNPSGGTNLARIETPVLNISLTDESINSNDSFELIVVAVSNNILKISEGVGVTLIN